MAPPFAALALALLATARQEPTPPVAASARGEGRREKTLAAELRARPGFLARVVTRAAAELDPAALRPHLAGMLRASHDPEALRLALRVMPEDLGRAHAAGAWSLGAESVRVLLAEIEGQGLEREAAELLQSLFSAAGEDAVWAGRLLLRAGGEVGFAWVAEELAASEPGQRREWVEACGASGRRELATELGEWLGRQEDELVAATGRVALALLGHAPARTELEELVKGSASERRSLALAALARMLDARELHRFAEEALRRDDLAPDERLALEIGLARGGASSARAAVRAALTSAGGAQRWSALRALARAPQPVDVEAFATLFPLEGEEGAETDEANALLAETLLAQRHAEGEPFLRTALWSDDWDLCVFAGGLIVRAGGTRALLDEIEAAPRAASEADLRRVGFALGEWGGLGVVEELRRTRSESDPVLQGALLGALSARALEPKAESSGGPERDPPNRPRAGPARGRRPG